MTGTLRIGIVGLNLRKRYFQCIHKKTPTIVDDASEVGLTIYMLYRDLVLYQIHMVKSTQRVRDKYPDILYRSKCIAEEILKNSII